MRLFFLSSFHKDVKNDGNCLERIEQNSIRNTSKANLIINFIDKGNADRHGFFETLFN